MFKRFIAVSRAYMLPLAAVTLLVIGGVFYFLPEKKTAASYSDGTHTTVAMVQPAANSDSDTSASAPSALAASDSQSVASVEKPAAKGPSRQAPVDSSQSAEPEKQAAVTLVVNGSVRGDVAIKDGWNQCDVLTAARDKGIISSLTMKYYSSLGSQGVFVIDGIGDESMIWWVYTVNGKSVPYGCSKMTAHGGERVEWKYVK